MRGWIPPDDAGPRRGPHAVDPARRALPARAPWTRWGIRSRRGVPDRARRRRPVRRAPRAADPTATGPFAPPRPRLRRRADGEGRTRWRTTPGQHGQIPDTPGRLRGSDGAP